MPQIVSLLPVAPAAPAATPATAPVAASGTLLPVDLTSPNFLAQFKAALKTIASVVVPPQLTQRPATDPSAAPLLSPVTDEQPDPKAEKQPAGGMPEMLAELGFAVVPQVFPQPTAPKAVTSGPADAAAQLPGVAQPQLPQLAAQPLLPQTATPPKSQPQALLSGTPAAAQAAPVQAQAQPQPAAPLAPAQAQPAAQLTQPQPQAAPAQAQPAAKLTQAQAQPAAQTLPDASPGQALPLAQLQTAPTTLPLAYQPLEHLKPSDQPQPPTPAVTTQPPLATASDASATVMLPQAPGAPQPTAPAPVASPLAPGVLGQPAAQGGPQSGGSQSSNAGSDHGRHTPARIASISPADTSAQSAPVSDAAMVVAAATAAPASAAPSPVEVGPSQVASQIAQHADLIRLPGNRGLRIQLHPDDLGGVQVTVRLAPGGGVELHINAEHAATGALVQAGWTELRDALASHGITADRLMLSVTAPSGAGQADLSGGGNRSDANPSSSYTPTGQGNLSSPDGRDQGQGQSRQDNPQQRTSPGWRGTAESVSAIDDNPRVASATAAPSRIDYRV